MTTAALQKIGLLVQLGLLIAARCGSAELLPDPTRAAACIAQVLQVQSRSGGLDRQAFDDLTKFRASPEGLNGKLRTVGGYPEVNWTPGQHKSEKIDPLDDRVSGLEHDYLEIESGNTGRAVNSFRSTKVGAEELIHKFLTSVIDGVYYNERLRVQDKKSWLRNGLKNLMTRGALLGVADFGMPYAVAPLLHGHGAGGHAIDQILVGLLALTNVINVANIAKKISPSLSLDKRDAGLTGFLFGIEDQLQHQTPRRTIFRGRNYKILEREITGNVNDTRPVYFFIDAYFRWENNEPVLTLMVRSSDRDGRGSGPSRKSKDVKTNPSRQPILQRSH